MLLAIDTNLNKDKIYKQSNLAKYAKQAKNFTKKRTFDTKKDTFFFFICIAKIIAFLS